MEAKKIPLFSFEFIPDRLGNTLVRFQYQGKLKQMRKTVSLTSFIEMLNKTQVKEKVYYKTGKLPEGYVNGAYGRDGAYIAVIHVPAKKRCLNYYNSRHFFIPFPELYFCFDVSSNGTISHKYCYAYDGTSNTLSYYPFGNVSDDGNICMGNIACKAKNPKDLERVIDDFFMSVTNDDYFSSYELNPKWTQLQLLEQLEKSKEEKYPKKFLCSNGILLSDIVDKLTFASNKTIK